MSYINEALQKAQKDNEANYTAYGNIINTASQKEQRPARRGLAAYLKITAVLMAVLVFLLYINLEKKEPKIKPASISLVPPSPQRAAIAPLPARPQANTTDLPAVAQFPPDKTKSAQGIEPSLAKSELSVRPVKKPDVLDPDILFAQAVEKQNAGKLKEAKELYREVIKNNPRKMQAFNNIGVVYMSEKNYRRAVINFNEALALNPNYVDPHYNLACLYSQKKDFARSLHFLQKAVSLNPEVRQWARKDADLQELTRFPDFNNLLEGQEN